MEPGTVALLRGKGASRILIGGQVDFFSGTADYGNLDMNHASSKTDSAISTATQFFCTQSASAGDSVEVSQLFVVAMIGTRQRRPSYANFCVGSSFGKQKRKSAT